MTAAPPAVAAFSADKQALLRRLLAKKGVEGPREAPIPRRTDPGPRAPLSFAQQRLWVLDRLEPGSAYYNIPVAVRLLGEIDVAALAASVSEIARRHETLRTFFGEEGGEPYQEIAPPAPVPLPEVDLAALPLPRRRVELGRLLAAHAVEPYDLTRLPVFRTLLLRFGPEERIFALSLHHIASDGWSAGVFLREVGALYPAFSAGAPAPLAELPLQYADFAVWQRGWLAGSVLEEQLSYWRRQLAGIPEALDLPTDRPRPAVPTFAGGKLPLRLPPEVSAALKGLCRERDTTPFVALLAVWARLLGSAAGTDDFVTGSTIANRNRQELEGLIGFFVNSLTLRIDLSRDPSFAELLERVREVTHGGFSHQDLPFERLVEELRPGREAGRNPLFQVMFNLLNTPLGGGLKPAGKGSALDVLSLGTSTAKFDLTLTFAEGAGGFGGELEYAVDLFDAATILRFADRFRLLLEVAVADPGRRLSELPLVPPAERHQLVVEWGEGPVLEAGGLLHELFERQAGRTPEAVALAAGEERFTYRGLDFATERLASRLRSLGVGPEERVGLCCRRTPDLVIGLLATLKAGGAYVPLDPTYPRPRLEKILRAAEPRVVLLSPGLEGILPASEARLVGLGEPAPDGAGAASGGRPDPENLAYLIYTSGSTGEPKGVAVRHGSAAAMVRWALATFSSAELAGVLFSTSINFDISVFELFAPLAAGGTVILVDDALALQDLTDPERVTLLNTVPSAGAELLRAGAIPPSVATVNLAGEPLPRELADGLGNLAHVGRVLNLYGPSEDTTYSTWARVPPGEKRPPAIGRVLAGSWMRVLDRDLRPVPVGVPGQIYLGGAGLARGYFGRPDLTADRFVPAPGEPAGCTDWIGERAYRTGDLARFRPDGQLEFLGRVDHQVKIRGFRIELADIEMALAAHPAVRECAVVARGTGEDRRLAAYVVREDEPADLDGPVGAAALRAHLEALLPAYMVPQAWAFLPVFPLTASGKIDRRALAQVSPETVGAARGAAYRAPRGTVEELLAGIWAEVLGLDAGTVGRDDDFFDLGGHSLLAMRALSRVREALGADFPLRALFEDPTVAAFGQRVAAARRAGSRTALPPVVPVPRGGELPLSFAQERMWFMDRLEGGAPIYNVPQVELIRVPLDPGVLARCFAAVVDRHEVLRTRILERGGRPVQVIDPFQEIPVPVIDLSALPAAHRRRVGEALAWEEAWRPFDLATGPVLRALLVRLAAAEQIVVFTRHHIVSDGWSMEMLDRELAHFYAAFVTGSPPSLPPLPVQYADFAVWQRTWMQGEVLEQQLDYWRRELAGLPPLLELPTDRPRPDVQTFRGQLLSYTAGHAVMDRLRAFSQREGASLFMTLLAAYGVILGRYSGRDDVPVGSPIANRGRAELEGVVGFFANTLVLRLDLSGNPTFRGLVSRVRERALSAYEHQDLPFERLVEELQPFRNLSYQPLFQVMLVQQNLPEGTERSTGIFSTEGKVESSKAMARFDLEMYAIDFAGGTEMVAEYNADLFDRTRILRLLGHWRTLLDAVLEDADRPIDSLPVLTAGERHQLAHEWGEGAVPEAGPAARVHDLFLRQAAATPAADAVVLGEERLTYAELAALSGRLARRLVELGAGPDRRVGLAVSRSLWLPVGVLGVLRAGAAYVPLDASYPAERLALMIEDAGLAVLVVEEGLAEGLPAASVPRLVLEEAEKEGGRTGHPAGGTGDEASEDDAAYVIYTSGSTGRPKGVVMPHRALVNLVRWQVGSSPVSRGAVTLQYSAFSFDVSFQEMFATWAAGGTLALVPEEVRRDPAALLEALEEGRVARLFLPFVALDQLAQAAEAASLVPSSLRHVAAAGEALRATPELRRFFERTGARLDNQYGPTETHAVSCERLSVRAAEWAPLPAIGRPIAGARLSVLDRSGALAPAGVPGELALGGEALARGYLGRPERTAERFVPDPLSGEPGARLYLSGDLARTTADGRLEFLGRVDHQVKVRGFRIEPGEVEAALAAFPGVLQAVAVARGEGGARQLVAFLVAPGGLDLDALRAFLAGRLPEPCVPQRLEVVESLPLTPSGKVDRKALIEHPLSGAAEPAESFVPPSGPAEEIVAGLMAEVLELPRLSVTSDFFAVGGHSLLATRLQSRLRSVLGLEIPLRRLFERPTPRQLAREVGTGGAAYAPIPPAGRREEIPLSFAQQRLWFLDRLEPGSPTYNLPVALHLEGALAAPALERALSEVVRRHEVLRTRYLERAGRPYQVIDPPAPVALPRVDLSGLPAAAREGEAALLTAAFVRRPFDLARGPVVRAALLILGEGGFDALFSVHHIASDGWSMGVLVRELSALYRAFALGAPVSLPELPIQYADFAVWQREHLTGGALEEQLAYWRERLAGLAPVDLPADRPRPPALPAHRRGGGRVALLSETAARLARQLAVTPFMVLTAAFSALVARATGATDVTLGTPIAGRNRSETEGLIGFFVNTLVLRTDTAGDPAFRQLAEAVRERALEAYAHQDLPFEKLVEVLEPERDLSRTPLFSLLLVLQNTPGGELSLPGLALASRPLGAWAARFDLTLSCTPVPGGLVAAAEYDADLFDAATIDRLLGHLGTLLDGAAADSALSLSGLPLLPMGERHQLLAEWNDVSRASSFEPAAVRIARVAAGRPGAPALVWEGGEISYGALLDRAGRWAAVLAGRGVGPEVRVGLALRPSPDVTAAVLAVWWAGGAAVPFDPSYPAARLAFMLADSGIRLLVTDGSLPAGVASPDVPVLALADLGQEAGRAELAAVDPDHLAYVIYTSGSTGRPKGVAVPHRGLTNLIDDQRGRLGVGPGDRLLQYSSWSFDLAFFEALLALGTGAALAFVDRGEVLPGREMARLAARLGVTVLLTTPSSLAALPVEELPGVRSLSLGGEACPPELAARWAPGRNAWNLYGPTETTIVSTGGRIEAGGTVTLGRPLAGFRAYVADAWDEPAPAGVPGELWIGGVGLARGYLGRPGATALSFRPDPWGGEPGSRVYASGDRARRLPDGRFEFLGRLDGQVKVRGFRIELGEIERALGEHPAVEEGVVVVAAGPVPGLAAFVVPRAGAVVAAAMLREALRERLPDYMVPAALALLPDLPRTSTGKVDRRALASRPPEAAEGGAETPGGEAPVGEAEVRLAALWSDLLGLPVTRRDADFFALGGHSLLATQAVSRAGEAFGVEVPLRSLFENPTLASFAAALGRLKNEGRAALQPVAAAERPEKLPLTFAQERLWFLYRLDPESPAYNIPVAFDLAGPLEPAALAAAFSAVATRHEGLRTTFPEIGGEPVQRIAPCGPVPLPLIDLSGLPAAERQEAAARLARSAAWRPFRLESGPLLRLHLLRLGAEEHRVFAVVHHIVFDGWSSAIFIDEAAAFYRAALTGEAAALPAAPLQLADIALWQRRRLAAGELEAGLEVWRRRLAGELPTLRLPFDRPRPARPSHRGGVASRLLPPGQTAALGALAQGAGATLFMALLAGLKILLLRYSNRPSVLVGADVAGRNRAEVEGAIGFFVNVLLLYTDLSGDPTLAQVLDRVRETALQAFEHQDVPFDRVVADLGAGRSTGRTISPDVMFVLQNSPRGGARSGELALEPVPVPIEATKADLVVMAEETRGSVQLTVVYSADRFDAGTVERLLEDYAALLERFTASPDTHLSELASLSAALAAKPTLGSSPPAPPTSSRRGTRRRTLDPGAALVTVGDLRPGRPFPGLLEPAVPDVDAVAWAEAHRDLLESELTRRGALLLRGFGIASAVELERLAETLTPELYGEYGDLPRDSVSGKVYSSTPYPPEQAILFHNESSQMHVWPRQQWFCCLVAPASGGETPIADGREVFARLLAADRGLARRFAEVGLLYVRNFTEGVDVDWREFFRTDDRARVEAFCRESGIDCRWRDDGGLRTERRAPALALHPRTGETVLFNQILAHHASCLDPEVRRSLLALFGEEKLPRNVYFGGGTPIPDESVALLRRLYEEAAVTFPWQAGDVLLVDNILTAHSRNPFSGPRKIVVAMGEMVRADEIRIPEVP